MKLALDHEYKMPTGVLGLAVTPDAKKAFVTCIDGTVSSVDLASGEILAFEEKHSSFASSCVLLPDGKTLITGGYDGMLIWHDVAKRKSMRKVAAHKFWNWQLALSPDGKRLATTTGQYIPGGWKYEPAAETEASVKVFDTYSGKRVQTFSHTPPALSCAFSPDGKFLAVANIMGEVRVWDAHARSGSAPVSKWTSPDFTSWGTVKSHHYSGGIYAMAFAPDKEALVGCGMGPMTDPMAGNGKMTWQRWNWRDGKKIDEIKDGQHGSGPMESVAWLPDGSHFVMAGRQAQGTWNAAIFRASDGELVHSIDTKKRITHAMFVDEGRKLVISGATGQPQPKDGKWGSWGRLQIYSVEV